MTVHLNTNSHRILLELAGRGKSTRLSDLCEASGIEPIDGPRAMTDLWLSDMVKREYGYDDNSDPAYSITWIGQDWIAKQVAAAASKPKPRWSRWWHR